MKFNATRQVLVHDEDDDCIYFLSPKIWW